MTPDADLYRRAAARCITRAPHLDADQLPPCNACLLAIASTDTGGLPTLCRCGRRSHRCHAKRPPRIGAGGSYL